MPPAPVKDDSTSYNLPMAESIAARIEREVAGWPEVVRPLASVRYSPWGEEGRSHGD